MVINLAIELMSRLPEWEKQERLNFAEEILQCIEMNGMLPPRQSIYRKDFWDEEAFEWEPEDEE